LEEKKKEVQVAIEALPAGGAEVGAEVAEPAAATATKDAEPATDADDI